MTTDLPTQLEHARPAGDFRRGTSSHAPLMGVRVGGEVCLRRPSVGFTMAGYRQRGLGRLDAAWTNGLSRQARKDRGDIVVGTSKATPVSAGTGAGGDTR